MQTTTLHKEGFTSTHPKEEGKFLWRDTYGSLSLLTIVKVPSSVEYGITWESYYGVTEYRNRNVEHLRGTFMKLEVV